MDDKPLEPGELLGPGEVATTNYGWTKPSVGASPDVWGGEWNTNLDGIDATVFGMLPKAGTTTNNNAAAGAIGEFVGVDQTTNVSLVNSTFKNITSISLTAGDWNVSGSVIVAGSVANLTNVQTGVSTTSAATPAANYGLYLGPAIQGVSQSYATVRMSLAATTTVYLVGYATFASGTANAVGSIYARRVR